MPPKKQGGKKNKNDDWDDEAAERKLAANVAAIKLKKEEEEAAAWSEESEDEAPPPPTKGKAAFTMLMDDSDEANSDSASEPEPEIEAPKVVEKKAPPHKKQEKKNEKKDEQQEKKKGKKGKKSKKDEEDEDLDAILADLEKPLERETGKGKKKGKKEASPADTPVAEAESSPAPEPAKEGAGNEEKEAEKVEEAEDGKKKKKKKKDKKKGGDAEEKEAEADEQKDAGEGEEEKEEGDEGGEGEGKKDKNKKKKDKKKEKKKAKKDEEEGGTGKKKKHVDLIKEMLRARQEAEAAEEAKLREEEERLEALERAREEEERLAREKKEAEKERKKAALERKKAEGTYMTAKEKERARLAAAKLEAAGISVPKPGESAGGERKPIIYMDKRALKKQQMKEQKKLLEQQQAAASTDVSAAGTPAPSTPARSTPEPSKTPEEEEVEDAWDAEKPEEEEPLDDWEMADEQEVPNLPVPAAVAPPPKKDSTEKTAEKRNSQEEEAESGSSSEESSSEEESSEEESSDEDSSEDEGPKGKETKEQIVERVKARLKKRRETAQAKRSTDVLRAPVICVLGHVDTGKTKMLDTIRRTNVQDGEAGGITQQIGATQVPAEAIKERCKLVRDFVADSVKLPGFLIIDTPGHESFSNLRSRGSSLCDFAILVVDIMHGLEPQTIESLKMLLKRQTPFVIALNKIDRLYGYSSNPRKDVYQHLKSQPQNTQLEFKAKYDEIVVQFAEQGLNVCLSNDKNASNVAEYTSMVPTSAFLGDGIGNLMSFIVNTTQSKYAEKLSFSEELDASVMEVKAIPGLGTTVDIILVNGRLRVGDILVLTGSDGAIMTPIRELLMPQPLKEMRVKNEYGHFKEVRGAQGVKVLAKGLEKTVAGLPVYVAHNEDEVDILKAEAEHQLSRALTAIKKKPEGVYVMASTLGSLEALLEFLKTQKIPYSNVNIGPVHKRDVQKAAAMKEHNAEYACILAFDVKVERDAQIFADQEGVRIFQADIIYHLEDNFLKYREDLRLAARKENENKAIFPCKLRVLPQHVFNARNPIVCGVVVEAGQLKRGTPICVPSKEGIQLGAVSSIQRNHEEVPLAKKGDEVCIKIENTTGEAPKLYGRHFNHEDTLVSRINRESIDVCKTYFRDDLSREDWQLVVQLKKVLDIM